jgi:hypothetical protein
VKNLNLSELLSFLAINGEDVLNGIRLGALVWGYATGKALLDNIAILLNLQVQKLS